MNARYGREFDYYNPHEKYELLGRNPLQNSSIRLAYNTASFFPPTLPTFTSLSKTGSSSISAKLINAGIIGI